MTNNKTNLPPITENSGRSSLGEDHPAADGDWSRVNAIGDIVNGPPPGFHPADDHHQHRDQSMSHDSITFSSSGEGDNDEEIGDDKAQKRKSDGITIAQKETKAVGCLRMIVFTVLLLVATLVSAGVYWYSRKSELEDFHTIFSDYGRNIVDTFQSNAKQRLLAIESLSKTLTSYAISSNQSWPFVTLPDFELRATQTIDLASVLSCVVLPIVSNPAEKDEWEAYSLANDAWFKEGLEIQAQHGIQTDGEEDENESIALLEDIKNGTGLEISPQVFRLVGSGSALEDGPGPYLPWWTMAPVIPWGSLVNYNTISHPGRVNEIQAVLQKQVTLLSAAADISNSSDPAVIGRKAVLDLVLNRWRDGGNDYEDGPLSDFYTPIFDKFDYGSNAATSSEPKKLVGLLTGYLYWMIYFINILPDGAPTVHVVLENTCNQAFTYAVTGQNATYVGSGDLHDPDYDELATSTEFGAFLGQQYTGEELPGQCLYKIRVYPTDEFEERYLTWRPFYFAGGLVVTFLATSLVFMLYDWLVERRQRLVLNEERKQRLVVSSLFPEQVRNRIYETTDDDNGTKKKGKKNKADEDAWVKKAQQDEDDEDAKDAIADRHENCSVVFMDLAGFTKWSDGRDPSEVFKLLETVYGQFDRAATRRGVFKIETIGDCYLAVTGLPNPQPDHAVILARFAAECQAKLSQITHKLANKLGEDTAELQLRIGINSGPVTAGVLRGDRARYQIFGDTVNTASRMETTGKPGCIQASKATAKSLIDANRKDWVRPRRDLVEAKGKGSMETFWIEPRMHNTNSVSTFHTSSKGSDDEYDLSK